MPDYNIYIHDLNKGSQTQSQTKAWVFGDGASQTKAWQPSQAGEGGSGVGGFNVLGMAKDFIKAHPYASAFAAGAAVGVKVADAVSPIMASQSGNYHTAERWNNIKSVVRDLINPFSLVTVPYRWQATYYEQKKESQQKDQQSVLLGDAYVNQVRRKV